MMFKPKVNNKLCTGCGICEEVCPVGAIDIINNTAVIFENDCHNCNICIDECPNKAINNDD